MDVTTLDAESVEVFGKFLGHSLCQCGDQHALVFRQGLAYFDNQVVHLVIARPHIDGWIQQACRTDDLLDHDSLGSLQLKVGRSGTDIDGLIDNAIKFPMSQGPVVQGGGKAKTVIDEGDFSRTVTAIHGSNLWNGDMALVDDHEKVFGKVIEQTKWPFTWLSAVEVSRVVLNARTKSNLLDHFKIVQGPFVQALGLQKPRLFVEKSFLFFQVLLDFPHGSICGFLACHKKIGGINAHLLKDVQFVPAIRINGGNSFDFIVPKFHPYGVVCIRQVDVDSISFDPEVASFEITHSTAIQARDKSMKEVIASDALPNL